MGIVVSILHSTLFGYTSPSLMIYIRIFKLYTDWSKKVNIHICFNSIFIPMSGYDKFARFSSPVTFRCQIVGLANEKSFQKKQQTHHIAGLTNVDSGKTGSKWICLRVSTFTGKFSSTRTIANLCFGDHDLYAYSISLKMTSSSLLLSLSLPTDISTRNFRIV